jgi:DNA-binding Lrp family transcriptional regulator
MEPDPKDIKIISKLKENSRYSIRDLSKKTGIRPSTIHQRIKKMVSGGVIEKFTVKLNNASVGENFIAFMLIKGTTTDYINNRFLGNNNIKEVFGVTGEYDVMVKLKFKNVDGFNDFVINFRKEMKGVQSTLTMVATANIKEEI